MKQRIGVGNLPALDWVNFLLADVKDGFGPFLAIFLMSSQHWDATHIGVIMTIAGFATVVARVPAGALVDRTVWKRGLIATAAGAVAAGAMFARRPNRRAWMCQSRHLPAHRRHPGSHVPYKSLIELRAVYMPDAAWAVSGHPPNWM